MDTTKSQIDTAEVREVRNGFERWRSGKKHGREPIPPKLWRRATALCEMYSVNRVARSLGLNHTALKVEVSKRSSRRAGLHRTHLRPAFVELTPENLPAGIISRNSSVEYVVEAPDSGKGMPRVLVRGASVLEVAALVRAMRADGIPE